MAPVKQVLVLLAAVCLSTGALAHSTRAVMDAPGTSATFTGLGRVTCFDDGSGPAALLMARVRDNSAPVAGLLINLQLLKGTMALNISDTVSGDANYSGYIALPGGNGTYTVMVNKTAAGARDFDIEWHCMTAGNQHTGTDIIVDQFQ
jgi:hypothetical protein